jgi:hypothetical protein
LAIIAAQRAHASALMEAHSAAASLVIDRSIAALLGDIILRDINNMPFDQIAITI